jgi:hypothetical protein
VHYISLPSVQICESDSGLRLIPTDAHFMAQVISFLNEKIRCVTLHSKYSRYQIGHPSHYEFFKSSLDCKQLVPCSTCTIVHILLFTLCTNRNSAYIVPLIRHSARQQTSHGVSRTDVNVTRLPAVAVCAGSVDSF